MGIEGPPTDQELNRKPEDDPELEEKKIDVGSLFRKKGNKNHPKEDAQQDYFDSLDEALDK